MGTKHQSVFPGAEIGCRYFGAHWWEAWNMELASPLAALW